MPGKQHTDGSPAADPHHPWFVYESFADDADQMFCQISPSGLVSSESRRMPSLRDRKVMYCSPDGRWLLLLDRKCPTLKPLSRRISIWNRVTKESIELPPWTKSEEGVAVISCSPDDPDCVVYLFMSNVILDMARNYLAFCRVGDKRWSFYNYEESIKAQAGSPYIWRGINLVVSLQGKIYGLVDCTDLVEISVDAYNNCKTTVVKKRSVPAYFRSYESYESFLVPWEDRHLYLIWFGFSKGGREFPVVEVLTFDFRFERWVPVPSLNGGAAFLGVKYSLASSSCSAKSQLGKWSFLYYTWHGKVHSYRMEDGRVTSYAPCLHRCDPCWIMPASHEVKQKVMENGSVSLRWNDVNCLNTMEPKALKNGCDRWNDAMKPCSKKCKVLDNDAAWPKMQKIASLCDLVPELLENVAEKVSSFVEYTYFLNLNKLGSDVARRRKNKFRPCLIYRDKMETGVYHITDSNMSREVKVEISQEVRGKSIGCCRDGWLLVENGRSCCLYNPLTRKVIEAIGCEDSRSGISNLTFIRSLDKSSVILAMNVQLQSPCLGPGKSGKAVWWKVTVDNYFSANHNSPVLLGEDWFYFGSSIISGWRIGRLRLLNINEGKFEWEELALECPCKGKLEKRLRCPCTNYETRNYLTECGGQLLSVYVDAEYESSWARVFKVCGDTEKEWVEIDTLGGYCLYLDSTSCISCVAETLDVADRVYFPKFHKDGLVYYSLKTMRYHSIGNEQDEVRIFDPMTMFTDCTWIVPDFSH